MTRKATSDLFQLRVETLVCRVRAIRQRAGVFLTAQLFDFIEDRAENISLVIRSCSRKIREILGALNNCDGALETHSGIDVALRCKSAAEVSAPSRVAH